MLEHQRRRMNANRSTQRDLKPQMEDLKAGLQALVANDKVDIIHVHEDVNEVLHVQLKIKK